MGTVCLIIASYLLGWIVAHNVVANECRKLGKDYLVELKGFTPEISFNALGLH